MTETIGLLGAVLTTVSFLPQTLLVIRTGKTDGISAVMYSLFTIGVACWLVYGVLEQSVPIMLANSITLVLASVILAMKVRSLRSEDRKALPA